MSDSALNAMAAAYCGQLKSFITCVHTTTTQLRASATQKPPAYADLSSFLLDIGDRAAEDAAELELLEEMTVDNVSFQDLLANCMELYKQNEASIKQLESQLEQFGYVKGEPDKVVEEKQTLEMTFVEDLIQRVRSKDPPREASGSAESKEDIVALQFSDLLSSSSSGRCQSQTESYRPSVSTGSVQSLTGVVNTPLPPVATSKTLDIDDMSMLGESFSLEDFGLSASTLASLARLDPSTPDKYTSPGDKKQQQRPAEIGSENTVESFYKTFSPSAAFTPSPKARLAPSPGILSKNTMPFLGLVSDEEYAQVFPWLQRRVSLTELNEAIVNINECMVVKQASMLQGDLKHTKSLEVEDTVLLNLGPNMKACLLFLVQIDRLVMASTNGRTTYRPSELEKFR